MIRVIILTAIIVGVIYIFIFRRIKINRSKTFDSVKDFHDTYIDKKGLDHVKKHISNSNNNASYTIYSADSGSSRRTDYITKYNSNEDYREVTSIEKNSN